MAGVPQNTLNWLFDVLKREYRDPNRAYSDIAQTLAQHPSLAPRTDVYTSDNGVPALLLNIKGTLPVNFRGTVYQFPIALWIPHAYPYEAPIVYVTPTDDMVVRPGQHVSASDGRVYHHYLARWRDAWDRSNVTELLKTLADVFTREPPVMAKTQQLPMQQQQQQQQQSHQGVSSPVPRPPPDSGRYRSQPSLPERLGRVSLPNRGDQPPPPPPKHSTESALTEPSSSTFRPGRYDAPPPLPHEAPAPPRRMPSQSQYGNGYVPQPSTVMQHTLQRTNSFQQPNQPREQTLTHWQHSAQSPGRPLPNSEHPAGQSPDCTRDAATPQSLAQNLTPQFQRPRILPVNYVTSHQQHHPAHHPPSQPSSTTEPVQQQQQARILQVRDQPLRSQPAPDQPSQLQRFPHQNQTQMQPPAPLQQAAMPPTQPAPVKDLLSDDDPFQISLKTTSKSDLPAPPIPTNPEKTALLSHISHLILQRLHDSIQQSQTSALPSLQSQHTALGTASQTLSAEIHQLQSFSSQLQSNIAALQSTINSANATIQSTQDPHNSSHADNIPPIDQIIIPPTVVARQLYDAVAEQRGYEAAIFALNEAFVRGRIGSELWGRKMRECAREEMRRKWLVRKIGEGLGLEE